MDFNFYMPTQVLSGRGVLKANADKLLQYGKRCMIVTSKTAGEKSGALQDAKEVLDAQGIDYMIYNEITENPLLSVAHQMGFVAHQRQIDFVLGIGGGSPLDAAKAIALFATNPHLAPLELYDKVFANPPLPVVLVGTTAGTGTEVTPASVLTVDTTGRKVGFSHPINYAKLSFADPAYTESMPYDVTVSTALDALSHLVEGWFCPKLDTISKSFAEIGLPMLWNSLQKLADGNLPSSEERDRLYEASLYAGLVINKCGTSFPHGFSYILTEEFGLPHGKACTVFMPELLDWSIKAAPAQADAFWKLLGTNYESFTSVVARLTDAPEIHMTDEQISRYALRWTGGYDKFKLVYGNYTKERAIDLFRTLF